jgi:hypothetical protein
VKSSALLLGSSSERSSVLQWVRLSGQLSGPQLGLWLVLALVIELVLALAIQWVA